MAQHRQVYISYNGQDAEVDEGIAPLILELWKAGICTTLSCQDNCNRVWIEFLTSYDAEQFLNIIASDYDEDLDSLYSRVIGAWRPGDYEEERKWLERAWEYNVSVNDWGVMLADSGNEERTGSTDTLFSISVRFPKSDLTVVVERLKAHNERQQEITATA